MSFSLKFQARHVIDEQAAQDIAEWPVNATRRSAAVREIFEMFFDGTPVAAVKGQIDTFGQPRNPGWWGL